MQLLYFHAGPGFNANPEINMLKKPLGDAGFEPFFWNEPSVLRPDGWPFKGENAFDNLLDSADDFFKKHYKGDKLVVVTHSFSCFAGLHLLQKYPHAISHYVTITPGYCVADADKNIFALNIKDFKAVGSNNAAALTEVLQNYTGKFDDNTITGYTLVAQNPAMFNNYWVNKQLMLQFLSFFTPPAYGVDVNGFISVRRYWYALEAALISVPATAIFGNHDSIIAVDKEKEVIAKTFSNYTIGNFENSSHYPHIEEADRFINILKEAVAK